MLQLLFLVQLLVVRVKEVDKLQIEKLQMKIGKEILI